MITKSTMRTGNENRFGMRARIVHHTWKLQFVLPLLLVLASCKSPTIQFKEATEQAARRPEAIVLREGDTVRITFPGTANLDTAPQPIRRDGNIALPLIGEVRAVGMTPTDLEKELVKRYSSQLVSKEVTVTVVSSAYTVYVTGAVLRPGKISSDHPISALEAIMEAGGFYYTTANLKAVTVIRHEGGAAKNYKLNLKSVLKGEKSEPFYLKPSDIVYVPERFSWF
jgi:protein involved in polysaccharide export with SLBB domain